MTVMMTNRRFFLVCLMLAVSSAAVAQSVPDTLREVKVSGKSVNAADTKINEFSPGQKILAVDSNIMKQYQMQSIANLLTQQIPVFVKTYSFNGLATLNFRGSSAAQSQVLWNGVPVQNAALGIADVSTLPVMFMSRVNIVYGGSAALYGSGNVGGALLLENDAPVFGIRKTSLSLAAATGSFGQYSGGAEATLSGMRWFLSVHALLQTASNDFPYTDDHDVQRAMTNSKLQSDAVMLHTAYKIDEHNTVGLSVWYQDYYREIPPALFEPASSKKQTDASLRMLLDWINKSDTTGWYAKSSFIHDQVTYEDISILIHTVNPANQYFQELGWKKKWANDGRLLLFLPAQVSWMTQYGTNTTRQQTKAGIAGAYDRKFIDRKLDVAVNARTEIVDGKQFSLEGADGAYMLTPWLLLRGNVQKTYRVPTLNELYYYPGGNSGLKPENGWNEDAGYTVKLNNGKWNLYHDLSVFNRDIHDWIIWMGGAIWTPHNIAEVHSRGVETENKLVCTLNKWKLHMGVNTSYVIATTVSSYTFNDGSIGKQIPYTPRYSGQLNAGFSFSNFYFNYNHTYTGYRFIAVDESAYLLPYNTGNLLLMYSAILSKHPVQFTAQCNNVWNQGYEIIAERPMPGINWLAGVRVGVL